MADSLADGLYYSMFDVIYRVKRSSALGGAFSVCRMRKLL